MHRPNGRPTERLIEPSKTSSFGAADRDGFGDSRGFGYVVADATTDDSNLGPWIGRVDGEGAALLISSSNSPSGPSDVSMQCQ